VFKELLIPSKIATDLGYRFADRVAEYFERIAELPTASAIRYKNVRCKPMKRFPLFDHVYHR
jgi:hypothetical protein